MGLFLPPGTPRGLCALMSLASRSLHGGAELPQPLLVSPIPPCSDVLALLCRTRNVHFPFIQARLHPFLQSEITLFPPFKYTPSPLWFLIPPLYLGHETLGTWRSIFLRFLEAGLWFVVLPHPFSSFLGLLITVLSFFFLFKRFSFCCLFHEYLLF